jgi:hypothetical protein
MAESPKPKKTPVVMSPVDSGWSDVAGYDEAKSVLHVKISGVTYVYPNVTPAKYRSFEKAKSKGKWFGKHLRDAPFKRLKKLKGKS